MRSISHFILLKMAFLSLRRHWVRSALALLGIVIGIAAMTITLAIGEGAKERLKEEILAMGENWMHIYPGNFLSKTQVQRSRKLDKELRYRDYLAILQMKANFQACTPCVEKKEMVKYQSNQILADIQGFNAEYFLIEPRGIKKGISFSEHHEKRGIPVAVLGSETARQLFKHENPVGKSILIGKKSFKVMGVFNEAPKKLNRLHNPNINVVVPFSSVWKKLIEVDESDSVHHITLRPKEGKNPAQIVAGMRRLLRFQHHLEGDDLDDFTIWDMQTLMQAAQKSSHLFNQFLLISAAVSLLVGGIGVMNVMLVAMAERKKEIGIKMAIGATSTQILYQFLIESVLLCLTGGIMGIIFGIIGAAVLGSLTDFDWALRFKPVAFALFMTIGVGVFFGFYPAYKASKLEPVAALQSF